jgi:hypothetical protein
MTVPLIFQRDEDDGEQLEALEQIAYVNIRRCNKGTWESVPRQYSVLDMGTEEQLYEAMGPGQYELIARDERNARIIRRQKVNIARPPGYVDPVPTGTPVQPVAPMPEAGGSDRMFMAMMQMMQQQNAVMMQSQAQQTQALIALITAVMQTTTQGSDKQVQQMAQMFAQFGQSQGTLLQAVLQQAGSNSPQATFLEGIKTAIELRQGMTDEKDGGNGTEGFGELMQAVQQGAQAFVSVKQATEPSTAGA